MEVFKLPIALFIDLEGLGMRQKANGNVRKIKWLFSKLPLALSAHGYEVSEATAFAALKGKRKKIVSGAIQRRVQGALSEFNVKMVWTENIADIVLIQEVNKRIAQKDLPHAVMLMANDGGFRPTIERLIDHKHFVFVTGPAISKKLQSSASLAVPLYELLS